MKKYEEVIDALKDLQEQVKHLAALKRQLGTEPFMSIQAYRRHTGGEWVVRDNATGCQAEGVSLEEAMTLYLLDLKQLREEAPPGSFLWLVENHPD